MFQVNPLIMTLGMASVLLGIVTVGLRGWLAGSTNVLDVVRDVGSGTLIGPLPTNVIVWAVVAVVLVLGLRSSGLGRMIYAVGDNPIACRLAGVRVWQVLLAVYVLAGAARRASGGLLFSGTTGSVGVDQTNSYLLPSVAATVIGGTSILGGIGGLQRHDPRRADPHRAQPPAAAPRRERGVQADALRRHRARAGLAVRPPHRPEGRGGRAIDIGVGVIGTGFMGVAHTEALRRLGLDVVGIVGSTPERARAKAASGVRCRRWSTASSSSSPTPPSTPCTSPAPTTSTPSTCGRSLAAGKHVVCEKPLGCRRPRPPTCWPAADAAGVVHAVCFNIRYYAHNQNAAALVAAGAIGEPRFVTGRYHQDWLLLDTDWNWRLDAARQGGLRAVADIGSHWLDLARFVTGRDVVEVLRRPAHVRHRARPPGRRRRDVRRRRRRRRTSRGCASAWRATTPPDCCCASRTG